MKFNPAALVLGCALTLSAVVLLARAPGVEGSAVAVAPPALDNPRAPGAPQVAVLAGGCFWGMQGVFEHVRGVTEVIAGYSGGERATAHYEDVSSGTTGHAESVRITFDPAVISYGQILQVFFSVAHDPTQLNGQGPDRGTQYRSDIFYADESQKHIAVAYIAQLNESHLFARPIATRVDRLTVLYPAEGYHQDYLLQHPGDPYIMFNDLPKIARLERVMPSLYNSQPIRLGGLAASARVH